jgi:hypothetical protein
MVIHRAMAFAAIAGCVSTFIGSFAPAPFLWPLVSGIGIYPLFAREVIDRRLGRATLLACVWALASTLAMWVLIEARGLELIGSRVIHGPEYAAQTLEWIRTGQGEEGSPARFLPVHARHFATFVVACVLTGGLAGICFGALLLNYMNVYVATLAASAPAALPAYLLGWPLWAVVRVVGFIFGGAALAHLSYTKVFRRGTFSAPLFRRFMGASVALVVLDVVLKTLLAEPWRRVLVRILHGPS